MIEPSNEVVDCGRQEHQVLTFASVYPPRALFHFPFHNFIAARITSLHPPALEASKEGEMTPVHPLLRVLVPSSLNSNFKALEAC